MLWHQERLSVLLGFRVPLYPWFMLSGFLCDLLQVRTVTKGVYWSLFLYLYGFICVFVGID